MRTCNRSDVKAVRSKNLTKSVSLPANMKNLIILNSRRRMISRLHALGRKWWLMEDGYVTDADFRVRYSKCNLLKSLFHAYCLTIKFLNFVYYISKCFFCILLQHDVNIVALG